jgi:hypothetical protein
MDVNQPRLAGMINPKHQQIAGRYDPPAVRRWTQGRKA